MNRAPAPGPAWRSGKMASHKILVEKRVTSIFPLRQPVGVVGAWRSGQRPVPRVCQSDEGTGSTEWGGGKPDGRGEVVCVCARNAIHLQSIFSLPVLSVVTAECQGILGTASPS